MTFLEVEVLNALKCDVSDGLDTVSSFFIAQRCPRAKGGREADHRLNGGGSGGASRMMLSGSNRR